MARNNEHIELQHIEVRDNNPRQEGLVHFIGSTVPYSKVRSFSVI